MEWLDYMILAAVAAGIVWAVVASLRAKKKGRGCCGSCSGCSSCSACTTCSSGSQNKSTGKPAGTGSNTPEQKNRQKKV